MIGHRKSLARAVGAANQHIHERNESAEIELAQRLYGKRPCPSCSGIENTDCDRCEGGVVEVGEERG